MDSDIRYGKELGVDDYLTKPIRAKDLLAVVRGKLRRAQQLQEAVNQFSPRSEEGHRLAVGRLQIDPGQHRVWLDDQELHPSAREFALLEYLSGQAGSVVSPQELVTIIHNLETDPMEAGTLVWPLILSLRRKMDLSIGENSSIENVRGVGYRLVVPQE